MVGRARPPGREPLSPAWSRAGRSGGTYYLYRTLRNLDLDGVLERLHGDGHAHDGPRRGQLTPLEERLARDEFKARIDQLRKEIEDEIRRRLVADRGTEALARSLRKPLPEDIDFMHATRDELASLRRAIHPLTRKLAVRLARKRRHGRKGPLDFRSTMRHSLSTGGVPVDPKFRYPGPAKPEIIVIADISGSVAAFARFTLHLVHAISSQFSKVRSFVFIDGIDEVTGSSRGPRTWPRPCTGSTPRPTSSGWTATPTTATPSTVFWERWGEEITPRTSVLLLGDARNNYHASQAWVVQEIRAPGPPRLLAQPRAPRLLGHRRLDRGRVRRALRRRVRVPQPPPARAVRRPSWRERRDRGVDGLAAAGHERGRSRRRRTVCARCRAGRRGPPGSCSSATARRRATCQGCAWAAAGCTGLTERGGAQAEALRDRLVATGELAGADALYASVLPRAIETAEMLAPALVVPSPASGRASTAPEW